MDLYDRMTIAVESAVYSWQSQRRFTAIEFADSMQAWFNEAWSKMPDEDWRPGFEAMLSHWEADGVTVTAASRQAFADWLNECEQTMRNPWQLPQLPLGTEGAPPVVLREDGSVGTLGPIDPRVLEQIQQGRSGRTLIEESIHVPRSVEHGREVLVPIEPEPEAAPKAQLTPEELALLGTSIAADFTPVVGQVKAAYEVIVGPTRSPEAS